MNIQARDRVVRARSLLIQKEPFFGCLSLHLAIVEAAPSLKIDTMATDGESIFYNPEFVLEQTEPKLIGTVIHEVEHCAKGHHARMRGRDALQWNIACDLAINPPLKTAGYTLFDGHLDEARFHGMGAEEIYAARAQEERKKQDAAQKAAQGSQGAPQPGAGNSPPQPSQGPGAAPTPAQSGNPAPGAGQPSQPGAGAPQPGAAGQAPGAGAGQPGAPGNGPGQPGAGAAGTQPGNGPGAGTEPAPYGTGDLIAPGNGSEAACVEELDKWAIRVYEAAAVAKRMNGGTMPGDAARAIASIESATVDYRAIFEQFVDSNISMDYSFSRPNRRHIGRGFYLPSTVRDAIDHLIFCIDTSGSIDQHMLAKMGAEVIAAHADGRIDRLTVIFADARVCRVQEFDRGDDIVLRSAGGGGTDFRDTFERIERDYSDATAIVYLTDMAVNNPAVSYGVDPGIPVLWAVFGDSRQFEGYAKAAPFGDAVYIGRLE